MKYHISYKPKGKDAAIVKMGNYTLHEGVGALVSKAAELKGRFAWIKLEPDTPHPSED